MSDWKEWSDWLREGYFITYVAEGVRYYEHIIACDLGHYEYEWFETVNPLSESGPKVVDDLVLTQGYDSSSNINQIWQMIFGIKGQVYVYVELPTDTHRHGVPKVPKPNANLREVSHFTEAMSDFDEPTFLTEHIIIKPWTDRINLSVYNPNSIAKTPRLNFIINKMNTERIGTEQYGELSTPTIPGNDALTARLKARWSETLEKLYKRQIPQKPLTIFPVKAPEAE